MDIEFADEELDRLETDPGFDAGLPVGVVRGYRKVIGWIRAAQDERDLRQMRSLRFEKLRGNRSHQHSMRLNDQYRLIIQLEKAGGRSRVVLVEVTDYH